MVVVGGSWSLDPMLGECQMGYRNIKEVAQLPVTLVEQSELLTSIRLIATCYPIHRLKGYHPQQTP